MVSICVARGEMAGFSTVKKHHTHYTGESKLSWKTRSQHTFEIHNGLKQGDALSPLLFNFVLEHAIKSLEEKRPTMALISC